MTKCPYKRNGLSEGDNLLVFYYLSASEIWPYKRGGLRLIKGGLMYNKGKINIFLNKGENWEITKIENYELVILNFFLKNLASKNNL